MISLVNLPSNIHIYDLGIQKWISIKTNNSLENEVYNFGPNDAPILRQIADWLDRANGKFFRYKYMFRESLIFETEAKDRDDADCNFYREKGSEVHACIEVTKEEL